MCIIVFNSRLSWSTSKSCSVAAGVQQFLVCVRVFSSWRVYVDKSFEWLILMSFGLLINTCSSQSEVQLSRREKLDSLFICFTYFIFCSHFELSKVSWILPSHIDTNNNLESMS